MGEQGHEDFLLFDMYTGAVYDNCMIRTVRFTRIAEKGIVRLHPHIGIKLLQFVKLIEAQGFEEARKYKGHNIEKLRGRLSGKWSARLSKGWRVYFVVVYGDDEEYIEIEGVDKHEY